MRCPIQQPTKSSGGGRRLPDPTRPAPFAGLSEHLTLIRDLSNARVAFLGLKEKRVYKCLHPLAPRSSPALSSQTLSPTHLSLILLRDTRYPQASSHSACSSSSVVCTAVPPALPSPPRLFLPAALPRLLTIDRRRTQGTCAVRQDHSTCVEAMLRPRPRPCRPRGHYHEGYFGRLPGREHDAAG